ncbi:hypothetical protein V7S43_006057 [Phytophthora oleae]|uniref:Uncharacterized protein n=1 Tax=Phytophthora oleae TaxID=2107226 RepID=A0ABD3FPB7_9STRA
MGADKRVFLISNLHRDTGDSVTNDITVTLPDAIFSGRVDAINMKHLYLDFATETLGPSNYDLTVTYPETSPPVRVVLDIKSYHARLVQTDSDLALLIASSINAALGTTTFQVYFNPIITANQDIYRDNSDMLSSYTIFTDNGANFVLDFSSKTSIGPLKIGFGNGVYRKHHSYLGGNIPPIYSYESIYISNQAYDPTYKQYDQATDLACKMDLYDSNNVRITNYLDPRDATISLPIVRGYIRNVSILVQYLETELNRYSNSFTPATTFSVAFDFRTYRFTITNSQGAMFGIGFRFDRDDGSNNYGSLHRHLGFRKRIYLGYHSITSETTAKIFDHAYIGEYIFVCSDLIKSNYDASLIVTESAGSVSLYESIFAIRVAQIVDGSYSLRFENEHRVKINASLLAKQYNKNTLDPKRINFYLKVSSGRHIKLNTQWTIKFEIEYTN